MRVYNTSFHPTGKLSSVHSCIEVSNMGESLLLLLARLALCDDLRLLCGLYKYHILFACRNERRAEK